MIRSILSAFATEVNSAVGLTPKAARPVFGQPVATVPSATIAVVSFGPGEETRISRADAYGRTLGCVLSLFAANDAKLLEYLDDLDALYQTGAMLVSGVEVRIVWGQATVPEPDAELDKTLHYQIQQSVFFLWG